jgi:hypothetical protein
MFTLLAVFSLLQISCCQADAHIDWHVRARKRSYCAKSPYSDYSRLLRACESPESTTLGTRTVKCLGLHASTGGDMG